MKNLRKRTEKKIELTQEQKEFFDRGEHELTDKQTEDFLQKRLSQKSDDPPPTYALVIDPAQLNHFSEEQQTRLKNDPPAIVIDSRDLTVDGLGREIDLNHQANGDQVWWNGSGPQSRQNPIRDIHFRRLRETAKSIGRWTQA